LGVTAGELAFLPLFKPNRLQAPVKSDNSAIYSIAIEDCTREMVAIRNLFDQLLLSNRLITTIHARSHDLRDFKTAQLSSFPVHRTPTTGSTPWH
jgi:hypothetical protein